jgi:hypothetical protein
VCGRLIAVNQCGAIWLLKNVSMWHFILSENAIPTDADLMLAVDDGDGLVVLEFPCRWVDGCWKAARTGRLIEVHPTHWREWFEEN